MTTTSHTIILVENVKVGDQIDLLGTSLMHEVVRTNYNPSTGVRLWLGDEEQASLTVPAGMLIKALVL